MRKTLLLLCVGFLFVRCVTYQYPMFQQIPAVSDFRTYADSGFIISPGMEGYKYKPIGLVSVRFYPGYATDWRKKQLDEIKQGKDTSCFSIAIPVEITKNGNFEPTEEYMISRMVSLVRNLGGNGLLNLTISYGNDFSSETIIDAYNSGKILKPFPGQRYKEAVVSGFAVKIEE